MPSPRSRTRFTVTARASLAAAVSLGVWGLLLSRAVAQPPASGGGGPARPPQIRDFAALPGGWVWIQQEDAGPRAYIQPREGGRRPLAAPPGVTEVAAEGEALWFLEGGPRGRLLRAASSGEEPRPVREGLQHPGGLFAAGGGVYWIEMRPGLPGLFAQPAAGPRCLLQRLSGSQVTPLAGWPCSEGSVGDRLVAGEVIPRAVLEGAGAPPWAAIPPLPGDVIGVAGGKVYVRVARAHSTEILAVPETGGSPSRVAAEPGIQSAVMHGETVVWTSPSDEATTAQGFRCVRSLALNGAVLTEWLPGNGALVSGGAELFYVGMGVMRLPSRPGAPHFIRSGFSQRAAWDGSRLVALDMLGAPLPLDQVR